MQSMTRPASYALGLLHDIQPGQGLQTYLSGIDATLAPYGGSFLIHGGSPQVVEGSLTCNLIVIGFPDADGANTGTNPRPTSSWRYCGGPSPKGRWCSAAAKTPTTVAWTFFLVRRWRADGPPRDRRRRLLHRRAPAGVAGGGGCTRPARRVDHLPLPGGARWGIV